MRSHLHGRSCASEDPLYGGCSTSLFGDAKPTGEIPDTFAAMGATPMHPGVLRGTITPTMPVLVPVFKRVPVCSALGPRRPPQGGSVSRIIQADPIGLGGLLNATAHAPNSFAWVDPTGLILFVVDPAGQAVVVGSYNELRNRGITDAHHVIQTAEVRELPGYSRGGALCVGLPGPSTDPSTPHGAATARQRDCSLQRGTLGHESSAAENVLLAGGLSPAGAATVAEMATAEHTARAQGPSTPTRRPGSRT